ANVAHRPERRLCQGGGPTCGTKWFGHLGKTVLVAEERAQVLGQVGVLRQQGVAVRRTAQALRLQEGRQYVVDPRFPTGTVSRFVPPPPSPRRPGFAAIASAPA